MKNYTRFEEIYDELKKEALKSNEPDKIRAVFAAALGQLAEYRNDEKKGLLVRFPFASGTEVYIVDRRGSTPVALPAKYIAKVQDPNNSAQNLCQLMDGSGLMVLTDMVFPALDAAQAEVLSIQLKKGAAYSADVQNVPEQNTKTGKYAMSFTGPGVNETALGDTAAPVLDDEANPDDLSTAESEDDTEDIDAGNADDGSNDITPSSEWKPRRKRRRKKKKSIEK